MYFWRYSLTVCVHPPELVCKLHLSLNALRKYCLKAINLHSNRECERVTSTLVLLFSVLNTHDFISNFKC